MRVICQFASMIAEVGPGGRSREPSLYGTEVICYQYTPCRRLNQWLKDTEYKFNHSNDACDMTYKLA